jgi:hypothetical protein
MTVSFIGGYLDNTTDLLQVTDKPLRGCRGHDRMVVGITTTYAISTYHH